MKLLLFKKRQLWLPTWPACFVVFIVFVLLAVWLFSGLHRFLAVSAPSEGASVLVVEAWVSDDHLEEIAGMLGAEGSPYTEVWLTAPPLSHGDLLMTEDRDTFAELAAEGLLALSVPESKIRIAPAADTHRHRTWNAARMLREEFEDRSIAVPDRFDLVTVGPHARRSRLVFQKVFGDGVEVGVIALDPVTYDAAHWYKSSAGMKGTLLELIAYGYEKIGNSGR